MNAKRKQVHGERDGVVQGVEDREQWVYMQLNGGTELDRCGEEAAGAGAGIEGYAAVPSFMNSAVKSGLSRSGG